MSLKDIIELIGVLPTEQQVSAINTITDSLGLTQDEKAMPQTEISDDIVPDSIDNADDIIPDSIDNYDMSQVPNFINSIG